MSPDDDQRELSGDPEAGEEQDQEAFLDEVVNSYIQAQLEAGAAEGKSSGEIEASFNAASMILIVRMLSGQGKMPEGAELLRALAQATGASDAECRELCHVFIAAGWLDAAYVLTDKGRRLAGIEI